MTRDKQSTFRPEDMPAFKAIVLLKTSTTVEIEDLNNIYVTAGGALICYRRDRIVKVIAADEYRSVDYVYYDKHPKEVKRGRS